MPYLLMAGLVACVSSRSNAPGRPPSDNGESGESGESGEVVAPVTWSCPTIPGAWRACEAPEAAVPVRPWADVVYAGGWGTSDDDPYESIAPTLFDPDGDGDLDLYVSRFPASPTLLERLPDGWRAWPTPQPMPLAAREAVTTDINGDGYADLLLVAMSPGGPYDADPASFYEVWAAAGRGDDPGAPQPEMSVRLLVGGPEGLRDATSELALASLTVLGEAPPSNLQA